MSQEPLPDRNATGGRKIARRGAFFSLACVAAVISGLVAAPAPAQQGADGGDWIGTWTASPQPVWDANFFAPVGIPHALRDQTLRHPSATIPPCAAKECGSSKQRLDEGCVE